VKPRVQRKVGLSLFFLVIAALPVLFSGAVDDFAPYQTAVTGHVANTGHVSGIFVEQLPGFYSFGAVFMLVMGVTPETLVDFPVLLIPLAVTLWGLSYKISKSHLLASCGTIGVMMLGIRGSSTVFYWPHGLGEVIVFSSSLLMLYAAKSRKISRGRVVSVFLLFGLGVAGLSYNQFFNFVTILGLFAILIYATGKRTVSRFNDSEAVGVFTIASVVFGLVYTIVFPFFLSAFIPIFTSAEVEVSTFQKLQAMLAGNDEVPSAIAPLLRTYPEMMSYLAISRYFVLGIAILFVGFLFLNQIYRRSRPSREMLFLLAVAGSATLFGVARIFIGSVAFQALYFPGLLALIWICDLDLLNGVRKQRAVRMLSIAGLILIVVSVPITYTIALDAGFVNRHSEGFESYEKAGEWHGEYIQNGETFGDELTRGFVYMQLVDRKDPSEFHNSLERTRNLDAAKLVGTANGDITPGYYLINRRLNILQLNNWVYINSWSETESEIDNNTVVSKIYTNKDIEIYENSSIEDET